MLGIIIQARVGSKRLPGKILMDLGGKSVLQSVVDNCKATGYKVCIATPSNSPDEYINEVRKPAYNDVLSYYGTGDENDVLNRYLHATAAFGITKIVRITADCPFIEPWVICNLVAQAGGYDYSSNVERRTFPKGFDCEYFTIDLLREAHEKATDPYDREHVTPWMQRNAKKKGSLELPIDLSYINLSIDTQEDLDRCRSIYEQKQMSK